MEAPVIPPPPPPSAKVEAPAPARDAEPAPVVKYTPPESYHYTPEPEPVAPRNRLGGAIARWPWLVFFAAIGVGAAYYLFQREPGTFASQAKLQVSAKAFEDVPVERALRTAAGKLNADAFSVPPPDSEADRVAFLRDGLNVESTLDKRTNAESLTLTFHAADAADAKLYLEAIVAAYGVEVAALPSPTVASPKAEVPGSLLTQRDQLQLERESLRRAVGELQSVDVLKSRVLANQAAKTEREQQTQRLTADLATLARLAKRASTVPPPPDTHDLDVKLASLEAEKKRLGTRLGPDHPNMVSLRVQISAVKQEIQQDTEPGTTDSRDFSTFTDTLTRQRLAVIAEIERLADQIAADEKAVEAASLKEAQLADTEKRLGDLDTRIAALTPKTAPTRPQPNRVATVSAPGEAVQVAPVLSRWLTFGGLAGLAFGALVAVGLSFADRGYTAPVDHRGRLGMHVLGTLPKLRSDAANFRASAAGLDPSLASFFRPTSGDDEAICNIRNQMFLALRERTKQLVVVTSPAAGDGASTLASNLAVATAQTGKRVLLVDANFHRPRTHRLFMLANPEVGLSSVWAGDSTLESAVRECEIPNLFLLPTGPRSANPAEMITSPKFAEMIEEFKAAYDLVVVDTPPVLSVGDAAAIAQRASGVVLVVRTAREARASAERAAGKLNDAGARLLGAVVNASSDHAGASNNYSESRPVEARNEGTQELPKKG